VLTHWHVQTLTFGQFNRLTDLLQSAQIFLGELKDEAVG
jgi:hypothetical protein